MVAQSVFNRHSKKEIIDIADKLIVQNIIKKPPVVAQEIAKNCGLNVIFVDFDNMGEQYQNISGFIHAATNRMFININEPSRRQNFTIAHELGHHILKHTSDPNYHVLYRNSNIINNDPLEQEANCFAANLLVPEKFLKQLLKEFPFANNSDLAIIFGVSDIVIRYRKEQLGIV